MTQRLCTPLLIVWSLILPAAPLRADERSEFFEKKIRPVLVEHCYSCHSEQANKQRGGLRLDTRAALLKGGESGPALRPGQPRDSLLLRALRHQDADLKMPPKGKLPAAVIGDFERWIAEGAVDPRDGSVRAAAGLDLNQRRQFWSFQPPTMPGLPAVKDALWARTPIDRFLCARLEAESLRPAPPADRRTLIRRASFDLTGLPPTPEEVDAFVADPAPDAFAKVVDRLLASPHYGERWGRYWLDVARYAEDQAHTFGVKPNTNAYRYRDWVIAALNDDMPFDQFVKLQIAADLLDLPAAERQRHLPALGFFGLGAQYYKNTDAAKAAADELDDRVDTLSRGFLGLTVSCARCHDHKFDPIPQQDYYSLAGVFESCRLAELYLVPPEVAAKYQEGQAKFKKIDAAAKALKKQAKDQKAEARAETKQQLERFAKEMAQVKADYALDTPPPAVHGLAEAKAHDMHVFVRGNPAKQGELAPRRFLRVLAGETPPTFTRGSGRLELAEAIASRANPLTARVIVNRVWQRHFGRGLVGTPSNFGELGERPTHPELLDYLACRLMDQGWSLKALQREIMLSAAYQVSSETDADSLAKDADNRWLGRHSRSRLDVEALRDAMLAVAGKLDRTLGGPTFNLADDKVRRRTVYAKISRHDLNATLRLFDFPDANITSERRTETTVPQQQLFVLNSPFVVETAKALAARVQAEAPTDPERVARAFRLAFGRSPTAEEAGVALAYVTGHDQAGTGEAARLTRWERLAQVLLASNEFLYID